jgi:hypothetical protein
MEMLGGEAVRYLRMRCCSTASTLSILFFVANICFSRRPSCQYTRSQIAAHHAPFFMLRSTCSPIMSHFRLKNASHSSVGFLAKYLQRHNGFRVSKGGDRLQHVET